MGRRENKKGKRRWLRRLIVLGGAIGGGVAYRNKKLAEEESRLQADREGYPPAS